MSVLFRDYELIANSGLFDPEYYIGTNPDVAALNIDPIVHYLEKGALELRNPSSAFDARRYAEHCHECGESVNNPLLHFIKSQNLSTAPEKKSADSAHTQSDEFLLRLDRIDIDRRGNATRLIGKGWAIATDRLRELRVKYKGSTSRARYGLPRADVARNYPMYARAEHSGFEFAIELPANDPPANVELVVCAKTARGKTLQKLVVAEVMERAAAEPARPPMQLFVDSLNVDKSGILHIVGWAICLAPITAIEVFIDDERFAAADFGKPRDDVAMSHADYLNPRESGFELHADVAAIGGGERVIKIQALALTGISREISLPMTVRQVRRRRRNSQVRSVELFCDLMQVPTAGSIVIKGWAVGPAATERLTVLLDGHELGIAKIGLERPDVGNHHPELPHARHAGFLFLQQAEGITAGEHLVTLRVRTAGRETEVLLPVLAAVAIKQEARAATTPVASEERLKLCVDLPILADGALITPVRGNLEIAGWALARQRVAGVEISIDGQRIKYASLGIRRRDVQQAFPDWEGALVSGFSALLPHRTLSRGAHTVGVALRDEMGSMTHSEFRIQVEDASDTDGPWSLRRRMTTAEFLWRIRPLNSLPRPPSFVLVLPCPARGKSLDSLRATIISVREQVYDRWLLHIIAAPRQIATLRKAVSREFAGVAKKIRFLTAEKAATGPFYPRTTASHLMVIRPGDELSSDALLEFAIHTILIPNADFLYCDERRRNPASGKIEAFFKPQWSPDLLLSMNYLGRAWCARTECFRRAGIGAANLAKAKDYDLVLRLTEVSPNIGHVPHTLLQASDAEAATAVERKALVEAIRRRGMRATIRPGRSAGTFRVCRGMVDRPLVSIIIPTCAARGLIRACIETLRSRTTYQNFEIVCVENIPEDQAEWKVWLRANVDRVIESTEPFNWSRFNNLAVAESSGELLLFLNDDIEVVDPAWLDVLVEQIQRPEVGVVGPQLLYPDRRVQHAGMFLAGLGTARHAFRYAEEDEPCYFGLALVQREVMAVTGACFITRRATFEKLGRFDETHDIVNNDLDYCLRVWQHGLRTIYTPHTKLIHYELASRSAMDDSYDSKAFAGQWRNVFALGDPYYHPRLAIDRDDFSCEWEATQYHCTGYPLFLRESVHRILVVKLDHIGDCVTSLAAVRRLKRYFPKARIYVLTGAGTRAVWSLEPAVDELLEFDFFHERSASGLIERNDEDWRELRARLTAYQFDLAVDLRKHWETRLVLQCSGARYLAGFDMKGKFPWLDVSVEWSEDIALVAKREHTSDELVNLVDAIGTATEPDRSVISKMPGPLSRDMLRRLPDRIFLKRVVCVHPTVGNATRQWPAEYFSVLIDQLIEFEDVHVVIIGGPDDRETADRILGSLKSADSAWSIVGLVPLAELPALIARCALFIGNNSGPHHIAAGLGVATVGIHSGVVDSVEWGPKGTNAVAVRRAMGCSPCYLSKVEDCNRGLACLRGLLPADVFRLCQRVLGVPATRGKKVASAAGVQSSPLPQHKRFIGTKRT